MLRRPDRFLVERQALEHATEFRSRHEDRTAVRANEHWRKADPLHHKARIEILDVRVLKKQTRPAPPG